MGSRPVITAPITSSPKPVSRVAVGDCALLRKAHPCGSFEWTVTRVGADIGLRCNGCGRRTMLAREAFDRGARKITGTFDEADLWNLDAPAGGRAPG